MNRLQNKIIFITGASSGIGKACATAFAKMGAHLILTARREDKITQLAAELEQTYHIKCLCLTLDVRNYDNVARVLTELPTQWQTIDVLINNAGLAKDKAPIHQCHPTDWDTMIDTNVKGLLYVTHCILPAMVERKQGHVINIGSISGHEIYPGGNVYCATKHAEKAITKGLLIDVLGTNVRISSIDPGIVKTEFTKVRFDDENISEDFYASHPHLTADDIADTVVYCANAPQHVTIAEMIVLPSGQASVNHILQETSE